jgi:hypothetical protein
MNSSLSWILEKALKESMEIRWVHFIYYRITNHAVSI